jgi:phosphonoacetaldehyde dehydrogenase
VRAGGAAIDDCGGDSAFFRSEALRIGGERVRTARTFDVRNPFSSERVGTVAMASVDDVRRALATRTATDRRYRVTSARRLCGVRRQCCASAPKRPI